MNGLSGIPLKRIDGAPASIGDFAGKALLIVNVASKCGLTPQYEGLEALYRRYRDRGFEVLGFPANDFGSQEPGSNEEIADFCRTNFSVDFPMFEKIAVTGADRHPLYDALVAAQPAATSANGDFRAKLAGYGIKPKSETDVLWNFEKFIVDRDGKVVGRFAPDTAPDAPELTQAIEAALG
ncbi:glutathione peroxidase [Sphingoaurantiacus capsulatus]|uniref:Glutathione peroxidase n=1 Tax=Sphingoaurantiacus capsulatus TaxID=1771310 RepID=A0ABV7X9T2_9SPHN